jgi:hypothetical protein
MDYCTLSTQTPDGHYSEVWVWDHPRGGVTIQVAGRGAKERHHHASYSAALLHLLGLKTQGVNVPQQTIDELRKQASNDRVLRRNINQRDRQIKL